MTDSEGALQQGLELPLPIGTLVAIFAKHSVATAHVFGSWARGEATPESDFDLLVTFADPTADNFFGLLNELQESLPCQLDLATGIAEPYRRYVEPDLRRIA